LIPAWRAMGDARVASPILYKAQPGLALRHRSGAKRRPRCGEVWCSTARPEKPPYDTHEERASAAWHIFYNTREKARTPRRVVPARWRSALLFGPFDASEAGLLSGITPQEHAQVSSTEPRGPYLYVRASAARACGVWHQVLCGLFAGTPVLQALARHNPLACLHLL